MSFPPLFKEQGKNANDLLHKGFPSSDRFAWRVEFDSISKNGVQFTPYLQQTTKSLEGELKSKFKTGSVSWTVLGNLKEEVSFEVGKNESWNGFKPTLTFTSTVRDVIERFKLKPAFEYRSEYGNSTLSLELPLSSAPSSHESAQQSKEALTTYPKGYFSLVLGHKDCGFAAGADVEVSTNNYDLKALNTAGSFNSSDLELSVFSKTKFGGSTTLGVNYFQRLTRSNWKDLAVGGELTYDGKSPSLSLGGTFKPDDASSVKTRINTNGLLGLSYTQRWGGPFTVTFSNDFHLTSHTDPAQFGIKISLK